MGVFGQLRVLVWKNIYIQTLRRHPIFTVLELLAITGIFYITMSSLSKNPEEPPEYSPADVYNESYGSPVVALVYGPNVSSPYMTFLLRNAFPDISNSTANSSAIPSNPVGSPPVQPIRGFETFEEVQKSCPGSPVQCFFLTSSGDNANINYTIVQHVKRRFDFAEKFDPEFNFMGRRETDSIASLQMKLERAHIAWLAMKKNKDPATLPTVATRRFPKPELPLDRTSACGTSLVLFVLAFIIPFASHVSVIVTETETGMKEMMKLMGLREFIYWAGHLLTSLFINVICCMAIGVILTNVGNPRPMLLDADLSLVETALLIFSLHIGMHTLFVSCFFKSSSVAVTFAVIYWFVLVIYPCINVGSALSEYMLYSRTLKLLYCATPVMGTHYVLLIMGIACDLRGSARWPLVSEFSEGQDNVTILEIWIVMLASDVAIVILIWYFTRVLPWVTGISQPLYFPILPGYWKPAVAAENAEKTKVPLNPARFEQDPSAEAVIVVKGLRKNFGDVTALNGIDVKFFKGEITVLLGHNGAGKTTMMNILTGILPPTEGTALICGFDVVKSTASAQKNITLCPQYDIFFQELTVQEHLVFFGSLRAQFSSNELQERVSDVLSTVKLSTKANELVKALSWGMMRRLTVAIAIVTKPQVLILDEPTAGIDLETRRDLWDLFFELKQHCSIMLCTHDMDEADLLGDRIGVMAHGILLCWGTPAFLRNAFSMGYKIHLGKLDTIKVENVFNIVRQTVPHARIESESLTEVKISLGVSNIQGLQSMFSALEDQMKNLRIGRIGVTVATMEDIYIKVNLEGGGIEKEDAQVAKTEDVQRLSAPITRRSSLFQQLRALLTKRITYQSRVWSSFVIGALLPVIIVTAEQYGEGQIKGVSARLNTMLDLAGATVVSLASLYPSEKAFVEYDKKDVDLVEKHYLPFLEAETARPDIVTDATEHLVQLAEGPFRDYVYAYVLGGAFRDTQIFAWWNPYFGASQSLSLFLANTALLRSVSGDEKAQITATVVIDSIPRSDNSTKSSIDLTSILANITSSTLQHSLRGVGIPLIMSLTVAVTVLFAIMERTSNTKALQLMSGMPSVVYWLSNLFFDAVLFIATWSIICVIFGLENDTLTNTKIAAPVAVIAIAFLTIPMSYAFSFGYDTQGKAFAMLIIFFTVGGTIVMAVAGLVWLMALGPSSSNPSAANILHTAMSAMPPCIAPYTLIKLLRIDDINQQCLQLDGDPSEPGNTQMNLICGTGPDNEAIAQVLGLAHCCNQANLGKKGDDLLVQPLSLSPDGIGQQLIILLVEGILFLLLICTWDTPSHRWNTQGKSEPLEDDDVEAERRLVEKVVANGTVSSYSLVVCCLERQFPSITAVRCLCFTVHSKECFGLLGVNGAGKTTTFQMLTGLLTPTSGDAYMGGMIMSKGVRKWQSRIGYCMQYGGLIGELNAFETLYLFARLRGIPENQIAALVDSMIKAMDLAQEAHRISRVYSGGNKRKLSIATAMIGLPEMVFLDEPSARVDIVARKKIFTVIKSVQAVSGMSMVLTSHSMDECEAVCDRIAIMVAGRLQCLGSLQHLKQKMGQGYTLTFKMAFKDELQRPAFETAVHNAFPGIKQTEYHQGLYEFHISDVLPWSELFKRIGELRKQFALENVFVSDTTLEKILVGLARKALEASEAAPAPRVPPFGFVVSAQPPSAPAVVHR
ncbi:phospholipid-transporting ATPase ABCA1-like isoform X1 [Ornithodoros turicata]|uniref:phospholipid-transporting ATPase ABCA1-like isoform X1 n=1 Tax=Ornithodoros turicata TaxID=34597 RepID=UPI00313A2CE8